MAPNPYDPRARRVRTSDRSGRSEGQTVDLGRRGLGRGRGDAVWPRGGQTSILVVRDPLPTKWGDPRAGWSLGSTPMDAVPSAGSETAPYTPFGGRHPS